MPGQSNFSFFHSALVFFSLFASLGKVCFLFVAADAVRFLSEWLHGKMGNILLLRSVGGGGYFVGLVDII